MNILVTGANGFIGSALVRRLVDDGHQVRCLVHRSKRRLVDLNVQISRGNVTKPQSLSVAMKNVELVYHLAGRATDWGPRDLFFKLNAVGTQNLLNSAIEAGARRFAFTSSLAVHRFIGHVNADEDTPCDQERYAYGASKVVAENHVRAAHQAGKIEGTIIRPGAVVLGPEDTTAFIHMAPLLGRGRWTHVDRGRPLLCYSYVDNLVDGLVLAGTQRKAAGETFILTDDLRLTWKEFISYVIAAFGAEERTLSFPAPVARAAGIALESLFRLFRTTKPPPITDYRTALVSKDFHFSCEKAKQLLGYRPRVSLREGLRRTVEWYHSWEPDTAG